MGSYAQEQSEWVFPTEKACAHDASVMLLINHIYFVITRHPNIPLSPSFATTLYLFSLCCAASFDLKGYLGGLGTAYCIMVSIATSEILGYSY